MEILEFRNQLQTVKKADVLKLIRDHRNFLEGIMDNLRLMDSEGVTFKGALAGWSEANRFERAVRVNIPNNVTFKDIMFGAVNTQITLLDMLEKDFNAGPNVIGKETATIREINGLMIDSYISFWVDYASRLMDMATSMMVKGKQVAQKVDLDYLDNELERFGELTYMLFEKRNEVIKRYKNAPKLVADEQNVEVLIGSKGQDTVLALPVKRIAPHNFNPVFWWESYQMERALKAYERHQNSIEANAQKISYYRDLQNKQPSPANEKMIEKLEDRIIKSQAAMERIEDYYR